MKAFAQSILVAAILALSLKGFAAVPDEKPLPTLEEIFPKVVERAKKESENERNFQSKYFFVRSQVKDFKNSKGEVKSHEAKTVTNNPALKRLSLAAKAATVSHSGKPQPVSDTHSNIRGKQFSDKDFSVEGGLLKRFEFTLVGRELVNGRPALIIDFQPAKGKLPENSIKEKFINKAAGRVWLDEEDYALSKVAIRLTEKVNVLGGLVGAVWKFTYAFERERVEDGIWYTRDEQWHVEGREVIIQRTVDFHLERNAVRKADVLPTSSGVIDLAPAGN
jgi:hypothetical protein